MKSSYLIRFIVLAFGVLACLSFADSALAIALVSGGVGSVAKNVTGSMGAIAKLITAGAYVAGFGFAVGAVVKFKAHKDNPTQVMISQPIALLFVGVALIFIPSVFKIAGGTMFGATADTGGPSGIADLSKP